MQTSASLQTHKHKLGSTHGGLAHSFPSPPIPSSLWVAGKEGGSIERERLRSDTRECVLERWREAGVCCKFLNCHPSASFFLSLSLWHLLWSVSFILTLSGSSFLPFPYRYRKKARGKKMLKTARWRKGKKKRKRWAFNKISAEESPALPSLSALQHQLFFCSASSDS